MPKIYHITLLLALFICLADWANAQFIRSDFQFESEIVSILNYNQQQFVATADKGLFVSDDGSSSWSQRWLPRETYGQAWDGVRPITIKQAAFVGNRLWAMTTGGMFASDDLGVTWRRLFNPYEYVPPYRLADASPYSSTYHRLVDQAGQLFVTEQYFDPQAREYMYRLLTSSDKGEHWTVVSTPPSAAKYIAATSGTLYSTTTSKTKSEVYSSRDGGKSWQLLTSTIPFETLTSLSAEGNALLATGAREIKDRWGSIIVITILATSLDGGQNWQVVEWPAVNFAVHEVGASLIHQQKFVVAMTNKITYSTGDGKWVVDSLGLKSPLYKPEGGIAVRNDTLCAGYMDKRLNSDQFALKGYLMSRPLTDLSPSALPAPGLLRADDRYRNTVILDWQAAPIPADSYYYSLERAEQTPRNFTRIAQLSPTARSYIDQQIKPGGLYFYRIRTEHRSSGARSAYSAVVTVTKPQQCIRAAYINYLEDVQMPGVDTLFARSGAELVRSVDGGKTWSLLNPCFFARRRFDPFYGKFINISFPTSRIGYAVVNTSGSDAQSDLLMKTTDGGDTWQLLPLRPDLSISRLVFVSPQTGYAISSSRLYKTTDGGRTFEWVTTLTRCYSLDYKNGMLIASTGRAMAFSSDGAQTWTSTTRDADVLHVQDANRQLIGVFRSDSTYVRLTTDGGKIWRLVLNLKRYDRINQIHFIDNQRGFLIGYYSDNGVENNALHTANFLYQTTDGGQTWQPIKQAEPNKGDAFEVTSRGNRVLIFFRPTPVQDGTTFYMGSLIRSDDAGQTWSVLSNLHTQGDYQIVGLSYRTETDGMLITSLNTGSRSTNRYFQYYTQDGGFTWLRATTNAVNATWFVRFISPAVGFQVANNQVFYTLDGTKSWQQVPISPFTLTSLADRQLLPPYPYNQNGLTHGGNIQFLSANDWVALSDDDKLYRTNNRGQSWQLLSTPTLRQPLFYFVNPQTGYVTVENKSAGNRLWKTSNGGTTWTEVGLFNEPSLYFQSETVGYAGLKRTTDGGKHWMVQQDLLLPERENNVLPNYRFSDDRAGYVGPAFYTADGGAHWSWLRYLSESTLALNVSMSGPTSYDSFATLINPTHYYSLLVRIVPAAPPCTPLAIVGDTIPYTDRSPTSAYTATMWGWQPNISLNWSIDGNNKIESIADKAVVRWNEPALASRTLTVRAETDCGQSEPVTLQIRTRLLVTALDPTPTLGITPYPNPAQTRVLFNIGPVYTTPTITWYDQTGRVIAVPGDLANGFDVTGLTAGTYLIRVHTQQTSEVSRLLIVR